MFLALKNPCLSHAHLRKVQTDWTEVYAALNSIELRSNKFASDLYAIL